MTTSYYAERANLSRLQHLHPQWSHQQLADSLGRSREWVKKWRKRLREEVAADIPLEQVLQGHSRARKHAPGKTPIPVVQAILRIRDAPPEGLRRVPGPQAIAYYLGREAEQEPEPLPVPSCRTIYRILKAHQRIAQRQPRVRQPLERPAPLSSWQLDFKDVSTVPADPFGKQQHVVETLNVLDVGTSILLEAQVREDFTAETALAAVAQTLQTHGMPQQLTLDRDSRWVGSPHGSDFPSALVRFCACLGIQMHVCDPRYPAPPATKRLCREISSDLSARMPRLGSSDQPGAGSAGHRGLCPTLQCRASQPGALLWQSAPTHRLSLPAQLTAAPAGGGS